MFQFASLLFIACLAMGENTQEYLKIPSDAMSVIAEASLQCISDTGVDKDVIQKLNTWDVKEEDNLNKFLLCLMVKSGYGTDEGRLKVDKMSDLVESHKYKDAFEEQLEKCNKLSGTDNLSTAFKVSECFVKKSPILFSL